jgi:AcrR family transcriptional regulator
MSVHTVGMPDAAGMVPRRRGRPSLLDVAAEVLVADPAAALAEVAEAAGIGRTTLHKHYATRDDLLRAVAHRALDLWESALDTVAGTGQADGGEGTGTGTGDADGGLRAMTAAMIPIGPQLAFLWRTPAFDHVPDIDKRANQVQERSLAVLRRAQQRGVLAPGVSDWWLLETFYSLVYVAAQSVRAGRLARCDAPGLVLDTFLNGIGTPARGGPRVTEG